MSSKLLWRSWLQRLRRRISATGTSRCSVIDNKRFNFSRSKKKKLRGSNRTNKELCGRKLELKSRSGCKKRVKVQSQI